MSKSIHLLGDGLLDDSDTNGAYTVKERLEKSGHSVTHETDLNATVCSLMESLRGSPNGRNEIFPPMYSITRAKREDMIVLSMGGNDVNRNRLKTILGAEIFVNSILNPKFTRCEQYVLEETKRRADRVALISLYLPYMGAGSSYAKYEIVARPVIAGWNRHLESLAERHKIDFIDISKNIDCKNRENYSEKDESRLSRRAMEVVAGEIESLLR